MIDTNDPFHVELWNQIVANNDKDDEDTRI